MSLRNTNNNSPWQILARTPITLSLSEAEKKLLRTFQDTFYWYNLEKDNQQSISGEIRSLPCRDDGSMDTQTETQYKELQKRRAESMRRIEEHRMQLHYLAETKELKAVLTAQRLEATFQSNYGHPQNITRQNEKPQKPTEKSSIKEKLVNTFGAFGGVLYFIISAIVTVLPFVMIGGGFWFSFLLICLNAIIPFASAVFWIWGLVSAIKGVQDVWAIIYYIIFAVVWLPYYFSLAIGFISDMKNK